MSCSVSSALLGALAAPGTRWHHPCDLASATGLPVLHVEQELEWLAASTGHVNGHGPGGTWSITELGLVTLMREREAAAS